MTRLTVSIVNWNTRDALRCCLESLPAGLSGVESDVVVVDNDSSDGSADMVAREFPHVRLMSATRNLGFAAGNNAAITTTSTDYVLILNPDVELPAGAASGMIGFLEHTPHAGAIAPVLVGKDGSIQSHMYRRFPTFAQIALFWTILRPVARAIAPLRRTIFEHDVDTRAPIEVDQLPGAAMMLRRTALDQIGMLDPGYFIWWEDVDWCFRARRAGLSLHVIPDVRCTHAGGASFAAWNTESRVFQFYRAFYRFLAIHGMHAFARRVTPLILADLAIKDLALGVRARKRRPDTLRRTRQEIGRILDGMRQGRVPDFDSADLEPSAERATVPVIRFATTAATLPVDVIIVNWNGHRYLPRCLDALSRSTVPVNITVVDNASTDGSLGYVASRSDAGVVALDVNTGYAAGANAGLMRSRGKYAFVMNPDVMIEPDHLEVLCDALDADERIGAAQGKLFAITADDFIAGTPTRSVLDSAGHVIRRSRMVVDRGQGEPDTPMYDREASVFSACGAALFLRRDMLEDIATDGEYFGESFFAYKEDIDLGWRARLLGWDVRYMPRAVAHHVRAVPYGPDSWKKLSLAARRHSWKNHYLLMLRNDRVRDLLRALPFVGAWELLRIGHALLRDPRVLPAYTALLRDVGLAMRARRDTFARRRVTPGEMRRWFGSDPAPVRSSMTPAQLAVR